jgi:hypothetical protein
MLRNYERHDFYSYVIDRRMWQRMIKVYENKEAENFEVYSTDRKD